MFDRLKHLYDTGRLPAEGLRRAVKRGWITPEQYTEITGDVFNQE